MSVIRLQGFLGENRALHPTLLNAAVGVTSLNQKPGRGDLRPWKSPSTVASVTSGHKTIYRMGRDVNSESQYWLSWSARVHAVRGFDADDTTERTYYTGSGAPKVTDNTLALGTPPYPTSNRPLGIPAPAGAPTVSVVGGTGSDQIVYYFYTYANDWGWESAPSPVSAQVIRKDGGDSTVTISNFTTAPAGNYGINKLRIYRTQVNSANTADFFFLREIAYSDPTSTTDDYRALGEVAPTVTWSVPPTDLKCLTAMWNGMMAGISGNRVRFCEPYTHYAWPDAYDAMSADSTPVGLAVYGQNLVVLTTGRPLIATGSSPDSLDLQPMEVPQACVSEPSIASMGAGVIWASEDGLCSVGFGRAPGVFTQQLLTREDWQAIVPTTVVGCMYEGLYLGAYSTDAGSTWKGFFLDPFNPQGIYFLSQGYEVMRFDELRDQLFVLASGNVQKWDAGSAMTYTFKSKVFIAPNPTNFAWGEVIADAYPVTLKVYANGWLSNTYSVASASPFRLKSGFLAENWQFEISGTGAVQSVSIANTIDELKQM